MKVSWKDGTSVRQLDSKLLRGLATLAELMGEIIGVTEVVVTSANDGVHKNGSLHYEGKAVDIRSKPYDRAKVTQLVGEYKRLFDTDYDLIWESQGTPNEHLHLEYDPGNRNH